MTDPETLRLPAKADAIAPDGSEARVLLGLEAGGMAHFQLAAGETSLAVSHRTVEEIWYFVGGRGEMWRRLGDGYEEIVEVSTGACVTIPLGTHFQFRALGGEPLTAVGVTMPPWPGPDEAFEVPGVWEPSVRASGG